MDLLDKLSLIYTLYHSREMPVHRSFVLRIRSRPAVAVLAAMALLFVGCQSAPAPEAAPPESASPVNPSIPSPNPQQPIPAEPAADVPAPSPEVPTQPAAPPVRTELAATDPASVNFASGKPTLVEFFAFW